MELQLVRIDTSIEQQIMDTGRAALRVSGDVAALALYDSSLAAISRMRDDWERDAPRLPGSELLLSDPYVAVAVVGVDVVILVTEVYDAPETYRRITTALDRHLPRTTQVSRADAVFGPPFVPVGTFLELRIALEAFLIDADWDVAPSDANLASDVAIRWLFGVGPDACFEMIVGGGRLKIPAAQLGETVRTQHHFARRLRIVATCGDCIRAINLEYRSAHISLIEGTSATETFQWDRIAHRLEAAFSELEPIARGAFIRHLSDLNAAGAGAYSQRAVGPTLTRLTSSPYQEREAEQFALVDAHGINYAFVKPPPLPPDWEVKAFGHLYRIQSTRLAPWLIQTPDEHLVASARASLESILLRA